MAARWHESNRLQFAALAIAAGALVLWRCQHLPTTTTTTTRDIAEGDGRGIAVPTSTRVEHQPVAPLRDPARALPAEVDPDEWLAHPFEVALENLPAGWYAIGVNACGSGGVDLGRHWLDGQHRLDLGTVTLPGPGRVHIESRGDAPDAAELIALRADFDVRMEPFPGFDADAALPAGDYALCVRRGSELEYTRFAVLSAATTRLTAPD